MLMPQAQSPPAGPVAPTVPPLVDSAPAKGAPTFPPTPVPAPSSDQLFITTGPTANKAEIDLLKDYVATLKKQVERVRALQKAASPGGTADKVEEAECELAMAEGELALAQNKRDQAIDKFTHAQRHAEKSLDAVTTIHEAGNFNQSAVLKATKTLLDVKRKLLQAKCQPPLPTPAPAADVSPPDVLQPALTPSSELQPSQPTNLPQLNSDTPN
jgi:hypothetical protein